MPFDIASSQVLSQPVSSYFQGRALRLSEDAQNQRMALAAAENTRAQESHATEQKRANIQFGEVQAKKVYAAAQQVMGADQPKSLVEQQFPEFIKDYEAHGGSWSEADDATVKKLAQGVAAHTAAELGIAPEKPEDFTLSAGQKRFKGGKVIASVDPEQEVKWLDRGDRLDPVNAKTGESIPGLAPRMKGKLPGADTMTKNESSIAAGKLRDDYTGVVKSTGWPDQQGFYQRMKAVGGDATGASDLALVFSFMKVLDPTSAVREGEYANAQNTAGIPGWVTAQYNKALSGEILSPDQRTKFMDTADKIYATSYKRQEAIKTDFSDKATRAGLNPKDVLVDFGATVPGTGDPVKVGSPADAMKLAPGTKFVTPDGRVKVRP